MGQSCQCLARLLPLILTFFFLPCLFCFVSKTPCPADSEDDGESEAAKQLIQPIAEKIIAKYKAKEEEAPLLFFVAGEVSERKHGAVSCWGWGLSWVGYHCCCYSGGKLRCGATAAVRQLGEKQT